MFHCSTDRNLDKTKNIDHMEQTINILTERERQLDDIDKAVRDVKYPPLNGGPTLEDLAGLLEGAAATIEELVDEVDGLEETSDRCEELQETINDAADKVADVITDLNFAVASGKLGMCKELEEILGRLMEVRSDLRRA